MLCCPQESGKPALHAMPLMSLAAMALDQPRPRPRTIDAMLKYIHTDAACVRYEPGPLARRQEKVRLRMDCFTCCLAGRLNDLLACCMVCIEARIIRPLNSPSPLQLLLRRRSTR